MLDRIKKWIPDAKTLPILKGPVVVDRTLLAVVLLLSGIGLMAVYSATTYLATTNGVTVENKLMDHVMRLLAALAAMVVFSQIDYHVVARFSKIAIVLSAILLIWVLFQGTVQGGARRAIFGFRPSDIGRFALILHVALLLTQKQFYIEDFKRGFLPIMVWVGLIVVLIGVQNVSTAMVLLVTVMAMGFIGRMRVAHLGGMMASGLVLALVMLMLFPARAERIESYLGIKMFSHTDAEEVFSNQHEGFQIHQAQIAVANGGFVGKGIGKSAQKDWLPEAYSDFIYAIVAEEYGLLGALFLLGLLGVFLYRGFLYVARFAPDPLGFFLATGITLTFGMYGLVHVCVNLGLMPVTGLPFPFVSWGGTSLVITGIMVGILLNISAQAKKNTAVA